MESPSRTSRKVRFTLPENENSFVCLIKSRNSPAVQVKQKPVLSPVDETKVHGTSRYVNGTLNFGQEDFKRVVEERKPKIENKIVEQPKFLRSCIKPPRKTREAKRVVDNDTNSTLKSLPLPNSLSKKIHYFIRNKNENHGKKEKKKDISARNRKANTIQSYAAFYFPDNELKLQCIPSQPPQRKQILQKIPDILTVPTTPINGISSNDLDHNNYSKSTRYANIDVDVIPNFQNFQINESSSDPMIATKIQRLPHMKTLVDNDENFRNFSQFLDRWCSLQNAANRKLSTMQINRLKINNKSSVHKKLLKLSDVRTTSSTLLTSNYRKRIMNIEKTPLVTSLLRASRDANIDELQPVIQSILDHGISKNDLNSVDKNGRTALSYICATSLTNVLNILLRIPGIDVNKADNEGNTPLHFAAEAGQTEIITMLTTRSRSLIIDSKNNFGLTPLMKAAVQGRTDCAKRLMLAMASPSEMDTGRGLRAVQWARLCGRKLCGDSIEQIARHQNLKKTTSCMTTETVIINKRIAIRSSSANISSKSSPTAAGGLATKLRSVFTPFYKKKLVSESDLPDLVTHMKLEKDFQQSENVVPIVEVTPANNQSLIEKYKSRYNSDSYAAMDIECQIESPKVPLRKKILQSVIKIDS